MHTCLIYKWKTIDILKINKYSKAKKKQEERFIKSWSIIVEAGVVQGDFIIPKKNG